MLWLDRWKGLCNPRLFSPHISPTYLGKCWAWGFRAAAYILVSQPEGYLGETGNKVLQKWATVKTLNGCITKGISFVKSPAREGAVGRGQRSGIPEL